MKTLNNSHGGNHYQGPKHLGQLEKFFPTTEAQKEIWAAVQMNETASAAYNESVCVHLLGELNISAFKEALEILGLRHESLRSTFSADGKSHIVYKKLLHHLEILDYSNSREKEQLLSELRKKETLTVFDITNGPLVRTYLVKFNENENFFKSTNI